MTENSSESNELLDFFSEIQDISNEDTQSRKKTKIEEAPANLVVAKPQVIMKRPDIKEIPKEALYDTVESSVGNTSTSEYSAFENASAYNPYSEYVFTPSQPSNQAVSQPFIPVQNKKFVRTGAGETWVDPTLNEWPENDYRLFVGDLGNEVTSEMIAREFQGYKSFAKAKVVRGGWNSKSRGYGFISFLDPLDCAQALRKENGKYIGNRPIVLRKSSWQERDVKEVRKKDKQKRKMQESLGLL